MATDAPCVRKEGIGARAPLVGGRQSGGTWRAFGEGSSQANAETQALANLNGKRALRYAGANDASTGRRSPWMCRDHRGHERRRPCSRGGARARKWTPAERRAGHSRH